MDKKAFRKEISAKKRAMTPEQIEQASARLCNKLFEQDCYKQAKELLLENQHVVKEIAEFLCDKESITGKEFVDIYNRVTGKIDVVIDEQIIIADDAPNEENNV